MTNTPDSQEIYYFFFNSIFGGHMLKVFLFFTVCIVCCSASFDSLGGASISLVNYYQTNPLVNIVSMKSILS